MKISGKEIGKLISFCILFFAIIALVVNEIGWLQNTLGIKTLAGIFAIIGLAIGIYLGHRFAKNTNDLVEKMRWYAIFTLVGVIIFPFLGSLTNRILSFSDYEIQKVELFEQKGFIADLGIIEGQNMQPDGYFSFVMIDGKLERLKSKKPLFPNAKKGDKVDILIKKGLFGFRIVKTN